MTTRLRTAQGHDGVLGNLSFTAQRSRAALRLALDTVRRHAEKGEQGPVARDIIAFIEDATGTTRAHPQAEGCAPATSA